MGINKGGLTIIDLEKKQKRGSFISRVKHNTLLCYT